MTFPPDTNVLAQKKQDRKERKLHQCVFVYRHLSSCLGFLLSFNISDWRQGTGGGKQDDTFYYLWKATGVWPTPRHIQASHRQGCESCLIFLSSRVNIWHKEALDSGSTIQVRHRMARGHERGPSWIQQAPGLKFQTTSAVILHTHTHTHTRLVKAHALRFRCNKHALSHKTHGTKTSPCKTSLVWRRVPHNVRRLVLYCENSGIRPNESFKAVSMNPEVFWKTKTFRDMDHSYSHTIADKVSDGSNQHFFGWSIFALFPQGGTEP